jgi:hypothetical protein
VSEHREMEHIRSCQSRWTPVETSPPYRALSKRAPRQISTGQCQDGLQLGGCQFTAVPCASRRQSCSILATTPLSLDVVRDVPDRVSLRPGTVRAILHVFTDENGIALGLASRTH